MSLSIRIICSPDGESITDWQTTFPESGGEIGRAYGCTMQLNDASRSISSTHAIIRKSSRGYQILDNSTNGLYINGADQALGKGNQSTLNDGDVLSIGKYRLLISCFSPANAKNSPKKEDSELFVKGDDPFKSVNDEILTEDRDQSKTKPEFHIDFTESKQSIIEDDPFLVESEVQKNKENSFVTDFSDIDDDPFRDEELSDALSFVDSEKHKVQESQGMNFQYALAHIKNLEEQMLSQTEIAIESAISRLLKELSPDHIESMFDDLASPGLFSGKPKYWEMYKRYFNRQMTNRDWQIKFHAYFQDSLRQQKTRVGE